MVLWSLFCGLTRLPELRKGRAVRHWCKSPK